MATFVHALVSSLADRWREVDVLLTRAEAEATSSNTDLHDVLCRASVVLVVAHLEGFVKDCARAVLNDINHFSTFKDCPNQLKRTFCHAFLPQASEKSSNSRVEKLIALLDGLDTKLAPEPFLFEGKKDDSRNPSPKVIEHVANHFGIDKFFGLMAASKADIVFTNVPSDLIDVSNKLRDHVVSGAEHFPYTVDPAIFDLHTVEPKKKEGRTLWETFLDDLLKKRHAIAHGSDMLNGTSASEIAAYKSKVIVLQYVFALLLCKHAVPVAPPASRPESVTAEILPGEQLPLGELVDDDPFGDVDLIDEGDPLGDVDLIGEGDPLGDVDLIDEGESLGDMELMDEGEPPLTPDHYEPPDGDEPPPSKPS